MASVQTFSRYLVGGLLLVCGMTAAAGLGRELRLVSASSVQRFGDSAMGLPSLSAPFSVTLPPGVVARLHAVSGFLGPDDTSRSAAGFRQFAYETFESSIFPPAGWSVVDNLAANAGTEDQFVWSRATCDVEPIRGGVGAAWPLGGGRKGKQLACGAHYVDPVDSWLVFGPFDTTALADGIRVNMRVRLDQPRSEGGSLQLCATAGPNVNDVNCQAITDQKTGWVTFAEPVQLEWTAGHSQTVFALRYVDSSPNGQVFGAMVDNIVVEGAVDNVPPSATATQQRASTAPAVPTATVTWPGSPTVLRFFCTLCPRPLPMSGRIDFPFVVAPEACGGPVEDIDVSVNVWHPWRWDVIVRMHAPGTNWLELFSHLDSDSNNVGNNRQDLTLDDEAPIAVNAGDCQNKGDDRCVGSYFTYSEENRQARVLRQMYGTRAEGTWGIRFSDDFRADTGTIMDWSVVIKCGPGVAVPTASPSRTATRTPRTIPTDTQAAPTATRGGGRATATPEPREIWRLSLPYMSRGFPGHKSPACDTSSSLADRLHLTFLESPPGVRLTSNWPFMMHESPIRLSVAPNGAEVVAWTDVKGHIHVTSLDHDDVRSGDDVMPPGDEVSDVVAHPDGFAMLALLNSSGRPAGDGEFGPDAAVYLTRYRGSDTLFNVKVIGDKPPVTDLEGSKWVDNIREGRLRWSGNRYATYVAHTQRHSDGIGHQGDLLRLYDAAGVRVEGGYDWGCSHSLDLRLQFNGNSFGAVCLGDGYPNGIRLVAQSPMGDWVPGAEVLTELAEVSPFDEKVALGGLVPLPGRGYLLSFVSRANRASSDVGMVFVSDSNEVGPVLWLTNSNGIDETSPHLARYGQELLASWKEGARQLFAVVAEDGHLIHGPEELDVIIKPRDELVTDLDGDVVWAFAEGEGTRNLGIARIAVCRGSPLAVGTTTTHLQICPTCSARSGPSYGAGQP